MRRVLFIHQNFPGQFRHLAPALKNSGWECVALRTVGEQPANALPKNFAGIPLHYWNVKRGTTLNAHPWVQDTETKLIRAEAVGEACEQLRCSGWTPDVIVGHPGWGEMLFLHHIWPGVPQLHYLEFFYSTAGLDVGFDPEFAEQGWHASARVTIKNSIGLLNLQEMSCGLAPTRFQASTYPQWSQGRIAVIHDGIDTQVVRPNPEARLRIGADGHWLKPGDPVITFVNRNLEPYRGYHRFIRALPEVQRLCPEAVTVIVGRDGVSYGKVAPEGTSWKEIFLKEVIGELDMRRVFFVGNLEYNAYLTLLQVSACHVYFTYPFVLGWSCLEALAAGALVVGSKTQPVEEVIRHGENGLLVDFFDREGLIKAIHRALAAPQEFQEIRRMAREQVVCNYDMASVCLPKRMELVTKLAGR